MVGGTVLATCSCWSLQGDPWPSLVPTVAPKRRPTFFLQHQGLFGLDPLSQIHQGPFEDKGSIALHVQLSRGFKVLTDPLCLNQC